MRRWWWVQSSHIASFKLNDGGRTVDLVVATVYVPPYYFGAATPGPAD
jgi:hypothetical protein